MDVGEGFRSILLGVDGGGTKTKAWVAALSERDNKIEVLGSGVAAGSNPRSLGFETAFENLGIAVDEAIRSALSSQRNIASACFSLSGFGRQDEQQRLVHWARNRFAQTKVLAIDDVVPLAFAAEYEWNSLRAESLAVDLENSLWRQSITLISGTGSIGHGVNRQNEQMRVGGWGYLLGDEGSGFALGLAGLKAVCAAFDGCAAPTSLTGRMLRELAFEDAKQLIGLVYQSPIPRSQIASLARLVLEEAKTDSVASKIVEHATVDLVRVIQCLYSRLNMSDCGYSLALSGGVLANCDWLVSSLLSRLQKTNLAPLAHHIVQEPVLGAVILANRALRHST